MMVAPEGGDGHGGVVVKKNSNNAFWGKGKEGKEVVD